MSEPVHIVSEGGVLTFTPPDPVVRAALVEVLTFQHTFQVREPTVFDARKGRAVGGWSRVKARYESRDEPLFIEEADGRFVTYDGLLHYVTAELTKFGHAHLYEHRGHPWPTPTINLGVFRGLDAHQREAVVKLLLATGGALAWAATAFGKTRVLAALIRAFPSLRILILTKATSVVRGLQREVNELLAEDGIRLGLVLGQKHVDRQRVTVSSVASAHLFDPRDVDLLLVDECHSVAGEGYSERIREFRFCPHYGLSASLDERFDGKEKFLESLFGPIVYRRTDQETEADGRTCPQHVYFLHVPEGPEVEHLQDVPLKRHGFWRNSLRNQVFADAIRLAPPDHQVLVFVDTIEHLEWLLKNHLRGLGFEACHGELDDDERKRIEGRYVRGEALRVIATNCLSTGVDPKHQRILVDASGVLGDSALQQKRGRNRRWAPGKTFGVILQADDAWSPKLARKAKGRRAAYAKFGDRVFDAALPHQVRYDVEQDHDLKANPAIGFETADKLFLELGPK